MKKKRKNNLLVEPPSSATGDIAFNLIVFFLVCASVQPDRGMKQSLPSSEQNTSQVQTQNLEIEISGEKTVLLNKDPVFIVDLRTVLAERFKSKPRPEDRVVVVKQRPDAIYENYIAVTNAVAVNGGTVTLQTEVTKAITVN